MHQVVASDRPFVESLDSLLVAQEVEAILADHFDGEVVSLTAVYLETRNPRTIIRDAANAP